MKQLSADKRVQPLDLSQKKETAKNLRQTVGLSEKSEAYKSHWQGMVENADSFSAFTMHLYQFKSQELWRESGRRSYDDFCKIDVIPLMKVPVTSRRLSQLAEYEEVKALLPKKVRTIVQTEGQARALKAAEPEVRAEILKEVASEGEVTAKAITEKIEEKKKKEKPEEAEFEEVIKDYNDEAVPKNIVPEFQRVERESKEATQKIQWVKNYLEQDDLTTVEARALRETAKDLLAGLKTHLTKHVLCPKCHGAKCAVCSKRGFVSNHFATKGIGKKED